MLQLLPKKCQSIETAEGRDPTDSCSGLKLLLQTIKLREIYRKMMSWNYCSINKRLKDK